MRRYSRMGSSAATPPSVANQEDGTDDMNYASSASNKEKSKSQHADIESLQQSAEIEGKIVLVTRGGCGFLEKVLWAQRRGRCRADCRRL